MKKGFIYLLILLLLGVGSYLIADTPVYKGPVILQDLTASRIVITDADKQLTSVGYTIATPTTGGLFYGANASTISALAAGTQYKVLQMGASLPEWSGFTIATPTTGGLYYGSNTTAISVLAAGTQNKFLQMGASLPAWSGYTIATPSTGGLYYGADTTAISVLPAGTANKILQMGAALPEWTNSPSLSALSMSVVTKVNTDSAYTVSATDFTIICNAVSGAIIVNLPDATGSGRILEIKKIDASANLVTPTGVGGSLIDGSATITLTAQWEAVTLQDTAVDAWHIL